MNTHKIDTALKKIVSGQKGLYLLCLASTYLTDIPGLSAAGANCEAIRLTPKIDAEYLLGLNSDLPVSPNGIVSPAFIAKIVLDQLKLNGHDIDIKAVNCGAFHKPYGDIFDSNFKPAFENINYAYDVETIDSIYSFGQSIAQKINSQYDYVVIAECVPGGTTSACGTLYLQGIDSFKLVSSSFPGNNSGLKESVIKQKLTDKMLRNIDFKHKIALIGDAMQAFVLGYMSKCLDKSIILAGGTQMLAVYSLINEMDSSLLDKVIIATTRWIAQERGFQNLASLLCAKYTHSEFSLGQSQHQGLRAYENGHIKEGLGLGALLKIYELLVCDSNKLLQLCDREYSEIVHKNKIKLI